MTFSQRIYNEMRRQGYFTGAPLARCLRAVESARHAEEMIKRLHDA